MSRTRLALALLGVGLVWVMLPTPAHAWTPGTHVYLGESVLANLQLLFQRIYLDLHGYRLFAATTISA